MALLDALAQRFNTVCSLRWEQVVDVESSLHIGSKPKVAERDEAAVQKLRSVCLEAKPAPGQALVSDG